MSKISKKLRDEAIEYAGIRATFWAATDDNSVDRGVACLDYAVQPVVMDVREHPTGGAE